MAYQNRNYKQAEAFRASVLSIAGRLGILFLQIFILLILSAFPLKIWHMTEVRPAFFVIIIYYWATFKPGSFPPLAGFIAGILLDLLYAGPLGLNALTLVGAQWIVRSQRPFLAGQSFAVLWLCFFFLCVTVFVFQWVVFSLLIWTPLPTAPLVISAVLTCLLFPFAAWLMNTMAKVTNKNTTSIS